MKLLTGFIMLFWGLSATEVPAPMPESAPPAMEARQVYSLEELEAMEMLPPLGFTLEVNVPANGKIGIQVGAESGKQMVVVNWNDPDPNEPSHEVFNSMIHNGFYYENYEHQYDLGTGGLVQIEVMVCPTEVTTVQTTNACDKGVIYSANISDLTSLKRFSFHAQNFTTFDISTNTVLEYLTLSGNQLSGTLDVSAAQGTLIDIRLHEQTQGGHTSNHTVDKVIPFDNPTLVGSTPKFPNLKKLNLTRLDMGDGTAPKTFYLDGCPQLDEVWLQYNHLTDVVMPDVSILPSGSTHPLAFLYCAVNDIDQANGTWDLTNYPNLIDIHIGHNALNKVLSNCAGTLKELLIGYNQFTSANFPNLTTYSALNKLSAANNSLGNTSNIDAKLPTTGSNSWNLTFINLRSNQFTAAQLDVLIDKIHENRCNNSGVAKKLSLFHSGIEPSQTARDKVDGPDAANCSCNGNSNLSCTIENSGWDPVDAVNHPFYFEF